MPGLNQPQSTASHTLASFAHALLAVDAMSPGDLATWNGSDPAQRFGVYRNNVIVSLIDALADTFEVTQALVGEAFFRAMAREFVQHAPPRSPVLAEYGAHFPEFIAGFPPAATLPYLADLARLEFARVVAFHAADKVPLEPAEIAPSLTDALAVPHLRLQLHPSLQVVSSKHAVGSLWAAHQGLVDIAEVNPYCPEEIVILRNQLTVEVIGVDAATAFFLSRVRSGDALGEAVTVASAHAAHFDLTSALALLLHKSAIVGIDTPRRLP